jgi:hypothetical protein
LLNQSPSGFLGDKRNNKMALEKVVSVDLIEVVENGTLQVRTKTTIKEDGVEISSKFQRHVVVPGADVSAENAKVQAIAASIHTAEVIAAYQAAQEAARLPA